MEVKVYDNQLESALRLLKKKLIREGFFAQIRERRYYEKPSVKRKNKQNKARRRLRKLAKRTY
jgi:small subunit ribosomal protein S21